MASISKRQQARNERELQELLRLPGNGQCADCSARNPGWASWNLGIFLCMRCASLHRKMGTHISKVKSLSMDTWSSDQVENMKRNGNTAVNQVFNPKNKKPDIPLDADEVDSAMERFIRKKYQEKSLESGRPEPPSRKERSPTVPPKSPDYEPAAPAAPPPKKHRFFGFGLRASSSANPLSRHDKKKLPPEPRVDSAFTISGDDYGSLSRTSDGGARMSDAELQLKLTQLKDMGFPNRDINTTMLRRMNGDVERTVAALVQMGPQPAERTSSAQRIDRNPTGSSRTNVTTAGGSDSAQSGIRATHTGASRGSNNPFDQPQGGQSFGLSLTGAQPAQQQSQPALATFASNNPFDQPARSQTDGGLTQAFSNMQVSQPAAQPLFPHSTGGYANQQSMPNNPYQTVNPAMMSQQYGYTASPAPLPTNSNPFFQQQQQPAQQMQPQATGTNPFFVQQLQQQPPQTQQQPSYATQQILQPQATGTNPFMTAPPQQTQTTFDSSFNPFGIPPSAASPPPTSQRNQPQQAMADPGAAIGVPGLFPASNPFQKQSAAQPQQQVGNNPFPNFQYGQQQMYQQPAQQFTSNPYSNLPQSSPQTQPQYAQPMQQAPMEAQQTGRFDKNSIMALYNYPSLAPAKQQTLSSIPEPADGSGSFQQGMMPGAAMTAQRSSTMPISMSTMHSAGGAGNASINRNPFMQNSNQMPTAGIATHSSRDSMAINNLDSGRHSPDAFANLSARYA